MANSRFFQDIERELKKELAAYQKAISGASSDLKTHYGIRLNRNSTKTLAKLIQNYRCYDEIESRYEKPVKNNPRKEILESESNLLRQLILFYVEHPEIKLGFEIRRKDGKMADGMRLLKMLIVERVGNNAMEKKNLGIRPKKDDLTTYGGGWSAPDIYSIHKEFVFHEPEHKETGPFKPTYITRRSLLWVLNYTMLELNSELNPHQTAGAILTVLVACGLKDDPQDGWDTAVKSIQAMIGKAKKPELIEQRKNPETGLTKI